jgi:hypothetical protein
MRSLDRLTVGIRFEGYTAMSRQGEPPKGATERSKALGARNCPSTSVRIELDEEPYDVELHGLGGLRLLNVDCRPGEDQCDG